MTYDQNIKINTNFQKSINLELDLGNTTKIKEYIITRDICNIIKVYLKACLGLSNTKSVNFVGPYGKGKSFLLLIISYLTGNRKKDKTYKDLLKKINKVDEELYQYLKELGNKKISLLPVIVNSNYNDLRQAFILALNDALQRENINDLFPDTVYDSCISIIDKWMDNSNVARLVNKFCANKLHSSSRKLIRELRTYSPESYEDFKALYRYMTKGIEYSPMVNGDILKIYNSINYKLKSKGYAGMLIIFDEFSKFLESGSTTIAQDMKVVQSFAELANRSSADNQMHFWVVTHKSLGLYKGLDKNLFKTVEGRFTEIRFTASIAENYEIISSAIQQNSNWKYPDQYIAEHRYQYEAIAKSQPYKKEKNAFDLFRAVFPLNPMTIVALIHMSEKVAQNERTLFTFICDTDDNSFNSFIHRNDDGLLNMNKVYAYFSDAMRDEKEGNASSIRRQAEAVLDKVYNQEETIIIKTLAIILVINDFNVLAPRIEDLSIATMMAEENVKAKVNSLIDRHYLRQNLINNLLSFASANSKEIDEKIDIESQIISKSFSLADTLNEINENRYVLPRRYNEQNKISRFFTVIFMSEESFSQLTSFDLLFENRVCDGLVINLLREKLSENEILKKTKLIHDERVVVRYPEDGIDHYLKTLALRHASLKAIIKKGGNDELVDNEMQQMIDEISQDISIMLESEFENNSIVVYLGNKLADMRPTLSDAMDSVYKKKIVFNNELVNKTNVTTQYQKSVNNVVNWLIDGKEDFNYSSTSPETTILNSVINKINDFKDAREAVDIIKTFIINSENSRVLVSEISAKLTNRPFGIRRGILPLLIGEAISELSDNVLFYLQDKEIELNAANISKGVYTDSEYAFGFARGSKSQTEYIENTLILLGREPSHSFRTDVKNLAMEYRRFFMGLPMIIRSADANNSLGLSEEMIAYKNLFISFNLNPYEVVCKKPLEVFKTNSYKKISSIINKFVQEWPKMLNDYKKKIVNSVKHLLNIDDSTSLKMGLSTLVNRSAPENEILMLNDRDSDLFDEIKRLSYEDTDAINNIAKNRTGTFIEDWNSDRTDELCNGVKDFIKNVSDAQKKNISSIEEIINKTSDQDRSPMGEMLYSNITTIFDEYGGSVSREEKVSILSKLLKGLLRSGEEK